MSVDNARSPPAIPASNATIQNANWSGSIPVVLSLAPASLSSPTPPRPIHKLVSRASYLHLALRDEATELSGYAPTGVAAGGGISRAFAGASVEEPPDDDGGGPAAGGGDGDGSAAAGGGESRTETDSRSRRRPNDARAAHPECWFEDEESGVPLRWHLFVGVLYDLMKGRATMDRSSRRDAPDEPARHDFLPWRIRVHFTSYPTDRLLPLDDGLDRAGDADDGHGRVVALVRRLFRNSLKQALFMQYASSKVAMSVTKRSHEKIWDAVLRSDYGSYHEVNAELQSGMRTPSTSSRSSATLAVLEDKQSNATRLIPVRLMLNGMPAIQKPTRHEKDGKDSECKRTTEMLERIRTCRAPPCTTLGDVLAGCLPDRFAVDPSTGRTTDVSDPPVYYCIQGVRPSLECAVVDLWRALSHPDHFLYIIVVTE